MTEVSYQSDEVSLEADDRRRVSVSTEGEVLSSTENILTGLPYGVHLLQELCRENVKRGEKQKEDVEKEKKKILNLLLNHYSQLL